MRPDSVIRHEGMNVLLEKLGKVDAERFITLIIKEPFDYTKWSQDMFEGLSVRELSEIAKKELAEKELNS